MPIDDAKLVSELKGLKRRMRFRLFTSLSMPAAAFVGLRINRIDRTTCVTALPGGWRTQNPFRTMYWAVQGMGAELATGAAPFAMSRSMPEKLRMFVVGVEGTFTKRAKGKVTFICEDVEMTRKAIEESLATGESVNCNLKSIGHDSSGDVVSEWVFKWNFRVLQDR